MSIHYMYLHIINMYFIKVLINRYNKFIRELFLSCQVLKRDRKGLWESKKWYEGEYGNP